MENHWMMVIHSLTIGMVVFLIMVYGMGQGFIMAERRSILIASAVLIYMILFGHNLPLKINNI
jgi:hypothetical protein